MAVALTKEQFEKIVELIEDTIGKDKPTMVYFDEQADIHCIVVSGEENLPAQVIMAHAIMILTTNHAMLTTQHYRQWLDRQGNAPKEEFHIMAAEPKGKM